MNKANHVKLLIKQESIPVGCVPPVLHRTEGVSIWGVSLTETPLDRDPPGQRPPGQRPSMDRDPPGQKHPMDRDPPRQRTPTPRPPEGTWDQAAGQEVTSYRPHPWWTE